MSPSNFLKQLNLRSDHLAWLLWAILILAVSIIKARTTISHSQVFFIYSDAATRWLTGRALYDGSGANFIYFPQSALLFTPFANLPPLLSSLLWRAINILIFALGIRQITGLVRASQPADITAYDVRDPALFLPVTVVSILLSWSAARYGQTTLIMAGLMMLASASLSRKRWNEAAVLLFLALAYKPLAAVMILLVIACYRPFRLPALLTFLGMMSLPFLFQNLPYVLAQYQSSITELRQASLLGIDQPFAQVFWLLNSLGITLPADWQDVLRLLMALATLGLCLSLRKRQNDRAFVVTLFALGVLYLLLFNPRTENNTYAMIGPVLGLYTVLHRRLSATVWYRLHLIIIVLFVLNHPLGKALTVSHVVWIKPALAIALSSLLLVGLRRLPWMHTLQQLPQKP